MSRKQFETKASSGLGPEMRTAALSSAAASVMVEIERER
jgi:hypothetical protein